MARVFFVPRAPRIPMHGFFFQMNICMSELIIPYIKFLFIKS